MNVVVSDLCYYNNTAGNYATIEERARMIIRLNMKCWAPNIYIWYFCLVRTEKLWWRNQGILGVGNRHDNIDPSFYYCAYTNTKCVESDQKKWLL